MLSNCIFFFALPLALISTTSPRYVSYIDKIEGWWPDSDILKAWGVPGYTQTYPYNVLNLAFLQSSLQPTDALDPWVDPTNFFSATTMQNITGLSNPTDAQFRESLKHLYAGVDVKLLVSAFGAGDYPTKTKNPTTLGKGIANFVTQYQLDGVDIDWEDSSSFDSGDGTGEYWLSNLTIAIKENLPSTAIITHAPQAPYFMGTNQYKAGGYLYIESNVGSMINWYNVQFYNQGSSSYDTFNSLFVTATGWATNSSVYQMINGNNNINVKIPSDKIIVGKPVNQGDADNTGYIAPASLETIFNEAIKQSNGAEWNAGFMDWQFSSDIDDNFQFANTVVKAWS